MTTEIGILFRLTWDEHITDRETAPRSLVTDSLTELTNKMMDLHMNPSRYSNVKKQAAPIEWRDV